MNGGGRTFAWLSGLSDYAKNKIKEQLTPQMQHIMSCVGMKFQADDKGNLVEIWAPDPERLVSAAHNNGVPITLESEALGSNGAISNSQYKKIVDAGSHPVGTNKLFYYEHDTLAIDHMPAVIVLRGDLFTILSLGQNVDSHKDSAHVYDILTSNITNAIEAYIKGDMEDYEKFIYRVCPGILNGYINGKPVDNGVGQGLDISLRDGMARLGIGQQGERN